MWKKWKSKKKKERSIKMIKIKRNFTLTFTEPFTKPPRSSWLKLQKEKKKKPEIKREIFYAEILNSKMRSFGVNPPKIPSFGG